MYFHFFYFILHTKIYRFLIPNLLHDKFISTERFMEEHILQQGWTIYFRFIYRIKETL